ncbi:MAG: hypothetical protein H0T73_22420 [Ardenticatenales bacterium]|nr:hypothetical protein [Ardenticatenales bacterium]
MLLEALGYPRPDVRDTPDPERDGIQVGNLTDRYWGSLSRAQVMDIVAYAVDHTLAELRSLGGGAQRSSGHSRHKSVAGTIPRTSISPTTTCRLT